MAAEKFIDKAVELLRRRVPGAPTSVNLSSLHLAMIVCGGSILSIGMNSSKKNGFLISRWRFAGNFGEYTPTNHAEIVAIDRVREKIDLRRCDIYVVRVKRDLTVCNSKPCNMCENALKDFGFNRAFFSISENSYGVLRLNGKRR